MDAKMNFRGQINIFVIVGIALVVILALLFAYKGDLIPGLNKGQDINPNSFFESCVEGKVKEAVGIMLPNGGYIEPEFSFNFKFEDEKYQEISYLCYNENYYVPCVNQEPMLIQHIGDEIYNYVEEEVESCFDSYISELAKENYEVDSSYDGFEIELVPKKIIISIDGKIAYEKTGETAKQEGFEVRVPTEIYDLAVVAQEIISQEAEYCNFEQVGFMLLNPEFELDKFKTGNSQTIYTLTSRKSGETFRFAVRGCVMPAGV